MVFSCRHPLKALFPKKNDACISSHLLSLLNNFETSLTASIAELVPKKDDHFITVSWMIEAMHSLCETHQSISTLIATTDEDLPVSDMEESMYADIGSKLLELCTAFTSELSRLNHGNMLLKIAFSDLEEVSLSHIDSWRQHMASKNPKIENCVEVLSSLVESINDNLHHGLYKKVKKGCEEEKVLMRALYGVRVKTLYIFSVFAAAFSGSSKNVLKITIPKVMEEVEEWEEEKEEEVIPWEEAFMELQNMIMNTFLSNKVMVIKDVKAVEAGVEMVYAVVQEGSVPSSLMVEPLKQSVMELSEKVDLVSKETSCLFDTVTSARDAMFERLRTKYEDELAESN
ncbi:hypothetical protein HA466_0015480 [Hirschfeldia incana]|nr:hypothetical protein HA466_0015480 [Hirschfeldia incana]